MKKRRFGVFTSAADAELLQKKLTVKKDDSQLKRISSREQPERMDVQAIIEEVVLRFL